MEKDLSLTEGNHSYCSKLLFLVYIIDLPDGLEPLAKLFADGTSLFFTVSDSS